MRQLLEFFNQLSNWATATPRRDALVRYLLGILIAVASYYVIPEEYLAESRGTVCFLIILAFAWYGGLGPGLVSLTVLVALFRYHRAGYPECFTVTAKILKDWALLVILVGVVGFTGMLRRRSLRLAQERERELRELHRRKDAFLATLAHELRNPMAPLRSGLEVLRLAAERPGHAINTSQVRQMMHRQVDHLVRLIDDLLEVSRINTGKIELRCLAVEIGHVVRDAVEASRPHMSSTNHDLTVNLADPAILLNIDPARMTQVLTNLLNNAAKFTPPGGQIELTAGIHQGTLKISVRDSGIGISAETLPTIFEMFVQAPCTLERGSGGLGIGLSLARAITQLHGGTLEAFSEGPGRGSEFVVTLPERIIIRSASQNDSRCADCTSQGGTTHRILIVDDNVDAGLSLAMLLSASGYHCQPVTSGPLALSVAMQFNPDVFLLDLGMPEMNGYELAQRLRSSDQFRDSLLIAVTGWGMEADRLQSRASGFDHHLVKPVSVAEIQELLGQHTFNSQVTRRTQELVARV